MIYVDGDKRYKGVKADIDKALELFPDAVLVGSVRAPARAGPRCAPPGRHGACWGAQDYDHREVRRAVDEAAKKRALDVYAEGGKYWVFYQLNVTT